MTKKKTLYCLKKTMRNHSQTFRLNLPLAVVENLNRLITKNQEEFSFRVTITSFECFANASFNTINLFFLVFLILPCS